MEEAKGVALKLGSIEQGQTVINGLLGVLRDVIGTCADCSMALGLGQVKEVIDLMGEGVLVRVANVLKENGGEEMTEAEAEALFATPVNEPIN